MITFAARSAALVLLGAFTACSSGSFEGKLVDGLTGQPAADVTLLARADGGDLTCQVREGKTDANGVFKLENTCSGAKYTLTPSDKNLLLVGAPAIEGGTAAAGQVELKIWRANEGDGVYILQGTSLKPVSTYADIAKDA